MNYDVNDQRHLLWNELLEKIKAEDFAYSRELWQKIYNGERFWSFPGKEILDLLYEHIDKSKKQLAINLTSQVIERIHAPNKRRYRLYGGHLEELQEASNHMIRREEEQKFSGEKPCFEILVLHPDPYNYYPLYYNSLINLQSERDEFYYDIIFVNNLADAALALIANENIQSCICVPGCQKESDFQASNEWLNSLLSIDELQKVEGSGDSSIQLYELTRFLRPEIETFYISLMEFSELEEEYFEKFHKVFFHFHPFKELHYHILNGVRQRFHTPFYHALWLYSKSSKTVFHALPISQGGSVKSSVWLQDFYSFYGKDTFNAESSGTQRGLDSLLNPKGAIKSAQDKAANIFGSDHSFFVTNGTSTSNKIVMQANLAPSDVVIVSSDCHKSVPYGVVLAGASCLFIQTNPLEEHDLYGASSLEVIKKKMLVLKEIGQLDQLKMVVLTNSTFDGLSYDVEDYMMQLLAIKPDLVFHWDEAWFAFAHFHPLYRRRHGMSVARKLKKKFATEEYRKSYFESKNKEGMPDPDKVKVRVYTTQSTHKTLSSFRQGSMIHVFDEQFKYDIFVDAYYTHTSTSPNYQILASLDIARRQMALEGFSLVNQSLKLALTLRNRIKNDKRLSDVFTVLESDDLYPFNTKKASSLNKSINELIVQYNTTGFLVDPTRVTLNISKTGLTGAQFRKLLINRYSIQVNKTSRHTVLFIVNIATTCKEVNDLLNALSEVVDLVSDQKKQNNDAKKMNSMPQKRQYAAQYLPYQSSEIADIRSAYYDAYNEKNIEYLAIDEKSLIAAKNGKNWISASFVTPYPPGFPLLVPGQLIDYDVLFYISKIINDEIHGFDKEYGLKVFKNNKGED